MRGQKIQQDCEILVSGGYCQLTSASRHKTYIRLDITVSSALQVVMQTSYSWHLLAQKSFQLPPPKLISNDYSSTVFEFPKQLHLPLGQLSLPDSLNSLDQQQTPLVSPGLETSKFLLSLHALIMHTSHVLTLFISTVCVKQYEIVAYIIIKFLKGLYRNHVQKAVKQLLTAIQLTSLLCSVRHNLHSQEPRWFFMKYGSYKQETTSTYIILLQCILLLLSTRYIKYWVSLDNRQ